MKRTRIRVGLISLAAAAVAAFALAGTGSATTPVAVKYSSCLHGSITVPAGSDVVVRLRWDENNRGRIEDFLNDETATATIDGTPTDVSGLYSPPQVIDAGYYTTILAVPVGTLAAAGDSVTIHLSVILKHRLPDGKDSLTGEHFYAGPGEIIPPGTCTITAA